MHIIHMKEQHEFHQYQQLFIAGIKLKIRKRKKLYFFVSAGVGRTGTYIAVDTIIRLLDCPNEELPNVKLDIMGIVYQLRKQRGKMVQTKVI